MVDNGIGPVLLDALSESAQAFGPLALILVVVFVVFFRDVPKDSLWRMIGGIIIATIGLSVFLTGVRIGFMPYAREMGSLLATERSGPVLIVVGFAIGLTAALAEPAVRVLSTQVDEFSSGYLKERVVLYTVALGVAISVALNMVRIRYGIPLFYIVGPGYLLALILMALSNRSFVGIAFDAGGVATGPMAVTFVMSLAIGVATGAGRDTASEGLGVVALVAMAPIITVLLLGLVYNPPWRRKEDES